MKKLIILSFITLVTMNVFSQTMNSGWQWIHPRPQGGYVENFYMVDANNWYALCDYGVVAKTTDAGASWTTFSMGYQSASYPGTFCYTNLLSAWFFSANNFLLGPSSSRGIVRTTNGGSSFDTVQVLSTGSGSIYGWWFINAQTGYCCGTSTYKLQKTTNGGANWSQVPNLGTTTLYQVYASDTNNITLSSTSGNTYYTTNAGANWTTSNVGTTNTLYNMKYSGGNLYVCGTTGCFRYSTNGGANWLGTSAPTTGTFNRIVVQGNAVYCAGPSDFIYKTTDNGTTWTQIAFQDPTQLSPYYINGFDINGTTIVASGTYGAMNKSVNSGANWTAMQYVKSQAQMSDIYAQPGTGKVIAIGNLIGSTTPQAIIVSSNGGQNWVNGDYNNSGYISAIKMLDANTGFICGRYGVFIKTTNGGLNWDTTLSGNATLAPYYLNGTDWINANTGWVVGGVAGIGGNTKIFKTTDGGVNWTEQTSAYSGPIAVKIQMLDANTGWICGAGQLQKTTNGGTNWNMLSLPVANATYNSIKAVDLNNLFTVTSTSQAFTSTDGGITWTNMNFPLTNLGTLFTTDFINANTGIVCGIFGTVGRTTDRGATWNVITTGGYTIMGVKMINADTAYAVAGNTVGGEVFKYGNGLTGGINYQHNTPKTFSLSQNYPNPFNPSTRIKFALPKAATVSLTVYDILGKQVAVIVDNIGLNSGTFSYEFDAENLATGIYFYTLTVDNNRVDTKKMILVK